MVGGMVSKGCLVYLVNPYTDFMTRSYDGMFNAIESPAQAIESIPGRASAEEPLRGAIT